MYSRFQKQLEDSEKYNVTWTLQERVPNDIELHTLTDYEAFQLISVEYVLYRVCYLHRDAASSQYFVAPVNISIPSLDPSAIPSRPSSSSQLPPFPLSANWQLSTLEHFVATMDSAQCVIGYGSEAKFGLLRKYLGEQQMVYWRFRSRDLYEHFEYIAKGLAGYRKIDRKIERMGSRVLRLQDLGPCNGIDVTHLVSHSLHVNSTCSFFECYCRVLDELCDRVKHGQTLYIPVQRIGMNRGKAGVMIQWKDMLA